MRAKTFNDDFMQIEVDFRDQHEKLLQITLFEGRLISYVPGVSPAIANRVIYK